MTSNTQAAKPMPPLGEAAAPWWRFPIVWMVVGGPLVVVVASFITLWLALTHPDPVLHESTDVADLRASEANAPSHLPALQARNHAATGGR